MHTLLCIWNLEISFWLSHICFSLLCSVEVCIFVIGSTRVSRGLWNCVQSFSGLYWFLHCVSVIAFDHYDSENLFFYIKECFNYFLYFLQRRDVYGAWEQYLGLEHSDNTPKRAYVNQVHTTILLLATVGPSVFCKAMHCLSMFELPMFSYIFFLSQF